MQFPEDYIWEYPGFPSLTVTYKPTSDFFFSGHVGAMTFCALENYSVENYAMMSLAIFAMFFESFVLLVTRAHYSIDLISGVVFAHYIWIASGWICPSIDRKFTPRKDKYMDID